MKSIRLFAILAACLLASCIDGREEIWLNADGSGRAEIFYSVPAAAARLQGGEAGVRRMIGEFLKDTPEISASDHTVTVTDDRLEIRVRAAFDSALDLKDLSTGDSLNKLPSSASSLAGKVQVKREGLSIGFSRTITAGNALPGAGFLPESRLQGRNLTYIIHLPEAATESNATRVANDGRTLEWTFPLATAVRSPVTTRFTAPVPIPIRSIVAAACAVALIPAVFLLRKLRRGKPGKCGLGH